MRSSTVNISFPKSLLKQMDRAAKDEDRSRSELLREAARQYVERKRRWNKIFAFGDRHVKRLRLKPEDVETRIQEYRREQGPATA